MSKVQPIGRVMLFVLAATLFCGTGLANPHDDDPILQGLLSDDAAEVEAVLAELREVFLLDEMVMPGGLLPEENQRRNQALQRLRVSWVPLLMRAGRYDVAADLAFIGVLAAVNPDVVDPLMRNRTRSLLEAGRYDQALSSARSYYYVCRMNATPQAINLVAEALAAARPDDPGIEGRFRLEQLEGAEPDGPARSSPTLESIALDGEPFLEAAGRVRGHGFSSRIRRGNLFLLAGDWRTAETEFQLALESARLMLPGNDDLRRNQINLAREGLARAARTRDGVVGRANAYLRQEDPHDDDDGGL